MAIKAKRKVREGVVASDKMDKTITVKVVRSVKHRLYQRVMRQTVSLQGPRRKERVQGRRQGAHRRDAPPVRHQALAPA